MRTSAAALEGPATVIGGGAKSGAPLSSVIATSAPAYTRSARSSSRAATPPPAMSTRAFSETPFVEAAGSWNMTRSYGAGAGRPTGYNRLSAVVHREQPGRRRP